MTIRDEKEIREIQTGNEVNLSPFADKVKPYIENPKDQIRNLLELIKEFSKVTGYKINSHKPLAFRYINNENSERKLRNQSHIPLQQKEKKKSISKLPRETKVMYIEN